MSGINFNAMIGEMFQARYQQQVQPVIEKEQKVNSQVSGIAFLKASFSSLYNNLDDVEDDFDSLSASVSTDAPFTAEVTSRTAIAADYDIVMTKVAEKHKVITPAIADGTIGEGTLTITVGATGYDVTIDSTNNSTLVEVASAINSASWNQGDDQKVVASVLSTDTGTQLVYQSADTGTDADIDSVSAGGTLHVDLDNTSLIQAAQNAELTVDGQSITSQSNEITSIPGVKVTLDETSFDGASPPASVQGTVTIQQDPDSVQTALSDFIGKFNKVLTTLESSSVRGKIGSESGAGPLHSNGVVSSLKSAMVRSADVSVKINSTTFDFEDIGIDIAYDGKMTLNKSNLTTFMNTNATSIEDVLFGEDALIDQMTDILTNFNGVNGYLTDEETRLKKKETDLEEKIAKLDARVNEDLDNMLAEMQRINDLYAQLNSSVGFFGSTGGF